MPCLSRYDGQSAKSNRSLFNHQRTFQTLPTVCSYLWFKSNYIPRALAAFGVISSGWCALCTFTFIMLPDFAKVVNLWWFDSPIGIFEIATSVWLLFKGLRTPLVE